MMPTLEDQLPAIEKLHEYRREVRRLRREAIDALCARTYTPRARAGAEVSPRDDGWATEGDEVEKAMMVHALREPNPKPKLESQRKLVHGNILADLKKTTVRECYEEKSPAAQSSSLEHIPVLRAALTLQVLTETPGSALSVGAISCFYRVVQEVHEVAQPAWSAGAARAGQSAPESAFIAGECGRALLAFATVLDGTADAIQAIQKAAKLPDPKQHCIEMWAEEAIKFRRESLTVSLDRLRDRLVVRIEDNEELRKSTMFPEKRLAGLLKLLEETVSTAKTDWEGSGGLDAPDTKKRAEPTPSSILTEASHSIAKGEVDRLFSTLGSLKAGNPPAPRPNGHATASTDQQPAGAPVANATPAKSSTDPIEDSVNCFRKAAQQVRSLLAPIKRFASAVVDRELASASPHINRQVDAAELLFAAAILGRIEAGSGSLWTHPKVKSALDILCSQLTADGRLLSLRAFDVLEKGYRLHVTPLEVTRRLAELIAFVDFEPPTELVERLIRPLQDTRAASPDGSSGGWMADPTPPEAKSEWWTTALAVDTLQWIGVMLDEAINRQVLRHFSVKQPSEFKLDLDGLFYPDFGLSAARGTESIAIKLQHLRAHAGTGAPHDLFSLILYGPPGTGKTTLVEALAKSAGVPLVEITPSDILVGGEEEVEHRARLVFTALSMLTHVVILLDEFDSILQSRNSDPESKSAGRSIFEFLTPGMLPKLKRLHDSAEVHRVSYVLATNFIFELDEAATRSGRFDGQHGIYPPDLISRLGQLQDLCNREEKMPTPRRILIAMKKTGGASMVQVGKPGWFTAPTNQAKIPLFKELGAAGEVWTTTVSREAFFPADREKEVPPQNRKGVEAREDCVRYWGDWRLIRRWEAILDDSPWAEKFADPNQEASDPMAAWNELALTCKRRDEEEEETAKTEQLASTKGSSDQPK